MIKENVLRYLKTVQADIDMSICRNPDTCKVENLQVICGSTRKRRQSDFTFSAQTKEMSKRRIKRQTRYAQVKWDIKVLYDTRNTSLMEAYSIAESTFSEITSIFNNSANNGTLNIPGFTSPEFNTAPNPGLVCETPYTLDHIDKKCSKKPDLYDG